MAKFDLKSFSQKYYCSLEKKSDTVQYENGEIVNYSEISIDIDKISYVWSEYDIETVPKKTVNI